MGSLLPNEIILEISSYLPPVSLSRFLRACKKFWNLRERANVCAHNAHITICQQLIIEETLNEGLLISTENNCMECIKLFMRKGAKDFNSALETATLAGNRKLAKYFFDFADNHNTCLLGASLKGYRELVELFIKRGAHDWNGAMHKAAQGGHKDLIDYFIQKGADRFSFAFMMSAKSGKLDIVDFFYKKLSVEESRKASEPTLTIAALAGYQPIVEYLIERGASNLDSALTQATSGNKMQLVEYLMQRIRVTPQILNECLKTAAKHGHKEMIEYFIQKGADDWNSAMKEAVAAPGFGHSKEIVEYFVAKGANDFQEGMTIAIFYGDVELVNYFAEKGACNWEDALEEVRGCLRRSIHDSAVVKYRALEEYCQCKCKRQKIEE